MATPVIGRDVMLYWHDEVNNTDVPFACALDATLTVDNELKEKTSQSSAWFREFNYGIGSWNIALNGLVILSDQYNYLYQLNAIKNRQTILVKFVIDNGGVLGLSIFSGQCVIPTTSIASPNDDMATYSTTLQGTGSFSLSGATITPGGTTIISGTALQLFQGTAIGGETTFTFPGAAGLELMYASRGGNQCTPIDVIAGPNWVTWNTATFTATYANPLEPGEFLSILAQ